jgi:hypothetical protein
MLCSQCGQDHPTSEIELTFRRPDIVAALSEEVRQSRVQENQNFCVLEGERFFVRVLLPLPVHGWDRTYCVGLWAETDRTSFERIYELWGEAQQSEEPPFEAFLGNEVPYSPGSLGLPVALRMVDLDTRPCVYLKPTSNPLYEDQLAGVSEHRIHEYTSLLS